jgi:hypothetical protein
VAQRVSSGPDRLPWLTEVPRIGPDSPPKKPRWEFPWGAVLIGVAFAFVAVAAYYLGIRKAARPGETAATQSMPLDRPYEETAPPPAASAEEPLPVEDVLTTRQETPVPVRRPAANGLAPPVESVAVPGEGDVAVEAPPQQQPAAGPVIVQPVVRGRIIQLGAYPSQRDAELSWQALVKKWPYLATKPRLVSPIDVRSTDGKATRMHRLQLATASQAQSVVICQQLAKVRQSCVVVY